MSRPLRFIIVFFLIVPAITRSTVLTARDTFATAQGDRERFVGAWRLAWLEEPGADGKVHRADCTGQFVFTSDGYAAVQVMYRNPGGGAAGPSSTRRADTKPRMADTASTNARRPGRSTSKGPWFAVWLVRT